jgi:hypothetical protein
MSELVPGDVVASRDLGTSVFRATNPNTAPIGCVYPNDQALVLSVVKVQTVAHGLVTWAMVLYDDGIGWVRVDHVIRYEERHAKAKH